MVLRLFPLLSRKLRVGEPELELGEEVVGRQKALELVTLCAVRVEQLHGRSPQRSESLKRFRLLLDVNLDWDEILIDEFLHARVGVNLGIQPGASPSHWGGIEIKQQMALFCLCIRQCFINILSPVNRHKSLLFDLSLLLFRELSREEA